ncbi:MAG TPA: tetratricopeptide repeat protein [Caulobacteraceae bacterium]|jgi:Flp pilus assembly protein TadD|nr:tetratricopeptide repeat protein [Caulobacteraceae bacterium]
MKRGRPQVAGPVAQALEAAARAFGAGRLEEAGQLAAKILKSDRGNTAAARLLGSVLILQGRPGEAIDPLQKAARRDGDPAIETQLAQALAEAGRGEEALTTLRLAVTRRPAHPPAFQQLGDRLGELGRYEEAREVFDAGLAVAPDAVVLMIGLGYIHLRRNDRAGARAEFVRARAAAPERRDAAIGLARIMAVDGEFAAAADLYRTVLQGQPSDWARRIELAKCLLELGERDGGEAMLRQAARARGPGPAIKALAATAHGRFFLRPSAAATFLAG